MTRRQTSQQSSCLIRTPGQRSRPGVGIDLLTKAGGSGASNPAAACVPAEICQPRGAANHGEP